MCVDYGDIQKNEKTFLSHENQKGSYNNKKGHNNYLKGSMKSQNNTNVMKKFRSDTIDNSPDKIAPQSTTKSRPPPIHQITQNSEEVIEIIGRDKLALNDYSILLCFIPTHSSSIDSGDLFSSFEQFNLGESSLDKAISECNNIKYLPNFEEGILLKCFDKNPMFPFVHYNIFKNESLYDRRASICNNVNSMMHKSKSSYGLYEEMFTINKMATTLKPSLPSHRHSGYIIITFKILDDCSRQNGLEKTWLSWSGAREIYKYSPRTWNLRKISLLKCESKHSSGGKKTLFEYVLLCEFGSIFHPANTIQALDMCERLKTRNCGHISLYQVQYGYESENRLSSNSQYPSFNQLTPPSSLIPSPSKSKATTTNTTRRDRNPLLRGVSQDVDTTSRNTRYRPTLGKNNLGYSIDEQSRFGGFYYENKQL
uniref:DUF7153 domain-containing protein n=1 Tax=Parastrongyloides trichosuri TaxID=131310 RepID=A0A0N4Z4M3_PARTI